MTGPESLADHWARWELQMASGPRLCFGLFNGQCDQTGAFRAVWNWPCGHGPADIPLCEPHLAELKARVQGGQFITCRKCQRAISITRIEAL